MSAVPKAVRIEVYDRDGWRCVAPRLDPEAGPCRNVWGQEIDDRPLGWTELTLEHVVEGYGRTGRRADHRVDSMVALCWGHHLGNGTTGQGGSIWALRHKDLTRKYLAERS